MLDVLDRLEDRVRTMSLVKMNPSAVQNLYVVGIRLCNTQSQSQAEAIANRLIFRSMISLALDKKHWPKTMQQYFMH